MVFKESEGVSEYPSFFFSFLPPHPQGSKAKGAEHGVSDGCTDGRNGEIYSDNLN